METKHFFLTTVTFDLPLCFQCDTGVSRWSSEWLHAACGGVCQPGTGQRARRGASQHRDQVRPGALAEEPGDPQPLILTPRLNCKEDSSGWHNLHSSLFLLFLFSIKHIRNRKYSLIQHHLTSAWVFGVQFGAVPPLKCSPRNFGSLSKSGKMVWFSIIWFQYF